MANVQYMVRTVETTVGVTIFFDENLTEAEIQAIGKEVGAMPEVKEIVYTSPDEAWETFRQEYFKGAEELAAGFADATRWRTPRPMRSFCTASRTRGGWWSICRTFPASSGSTTPRTRPQAFPISTRSWGFYPR